MKNEMRSEIIYLFLVDLCCFSVRKNVGMTMFQICVCVSVCLSVRCNSLSPPPPPQQRFFLLLFLSHRIPDQNEINRDFRL